MLMNFKSVRESVLLIFNIEENCTQERITHLKLETCQ